MLTGDKLETATCTAKNAHLVTRNQDIHVFRLVKHRAGVLWGDVCVCPVTWSEPLKEGGQPLVASHGCVSY